MCIGDDVDCRLLCVFGLTLLLFHITAHFIMCGYMQFCYVNAHTHTTSTTNNTNT